MERGHMDTRNAGIALVSMVRKITNKITILDFIQSEPVSDVVKPATYRLFFIFLRTTSVFPMKTAILLTTEIRMHRNAFSA